MEAGLRICFAVRASEGLQSIVYNHFGSAPAFVIADTEEGSMTTTINDVAHHLQGACTPIQILVNMRIDAVVVGAIGVGAIMKLNFEGIKVYRSGGTTINDNLNLIMIGGLREFTLDHACGGVRSGCSYL
jgi:predicted Fe-Mo cluster-binding NifX family protein